MNYKDILEQHRNITKVQIDSTSDAQSFWKELTDEVFYTLKNYDLKYAMRSFPDYDELELVTKRGKLLKRFAAFYTNEGNPRLDSDVLGKIGDKLQTYVQQAVNTFYFDFTDKIDWKDGEFGKDDSCWWNTYKDSIPTFIKAGGWGIRFYEDDNQNNENGIGRTWLVPDFENALVCFNSYGVSRANTSKVIKKVFSGHGIELHYKTADVCNSCSSTIPYINGGTGFVLFEEGTEVPSEIVFNMPLTKIHACSNCGKFDTLAQPFREHEHNFWCEACFARYHSHCEICDNLKRNLDLRQTYNPNHIRVCNSCLQDNFKLCSDCVLYHGNCTETKDGYYLCSGCSKNKFTCPDCDNLYYRKTSCNCQSSKIEYNAIKDSFERKPIKTQLFGIPTRERVALVHKDIPGLAAIRLENGYSVYHRYGALVRKRLDIMDAFRLIVALRDIDWTQQVSEIRRQPAFQNFQQIVKDTCD